MNSSDLFRNLGKLKAKTRHTNNVHAICPWEAHWPKALPFPWHRPTAHGYGNVIFPSSFSSCNRRGTQAAERERGLPSATCFQVCSMCQQHLSKAPLWLTKFSFSASVVIQCHIKAPLVLFIVLK